MRLFATVMSLLLLSRLSLCTYTTVPLGYGYAEDEETRVRKCGTLKFELDVNETHVLPQLLQKRCKLADLRNGMSRVKRVIDPFTTGFIVAALITFAIFYVADNEMFIYQSNKRHEIVEKIIEKLKNNLKLTEEELKAIIIKTDEEEFERISSLLFQSSKLEMLLNIFKQNATNLLTTIGFDQQIGNDIMNTLEYTFQCGETAIDYSLEICGMISPTRIYGDVKLVAPNGAFYPGGKVYQYWDSPRYAVFTPDGPVSASMCTKIGSHFSCILNKGDCNLTEYKKCTAKQVYTPDEIFSMELGDATVVSTNLRKYTKYENDSSSIHDLPRSGQFLLRVPHDCHIEIGNRKFYGRHDVLELVQISVRETLQEKTHEQIDDFAKKQKEGGVLIHELNILNMHATKGWSFDWDSCKYYWIRVVLIVGFLSVLGIIVIIKFCRWICTKTSNKVKKNTNGENVSETV